ncbi:phosphoribosylanthranilate isomerase [Methylomonas sp. ZR1]|uniref:phosphoribosylanthranilate isomerase n=1 Tax=Methylomonas sp. ZR1 TaxID=1797072 RepID=UPI0014922206|nr:phosphoribosylanthranilate isomerase [Methylomonas sp. ZR1]NOV29447.1 phosphoribosylanthranilate isomerase [Methylomonas sp. ZR1]
MRTRVKICGFTQVEDALYAANLGVDAIGLVFYPPSLRNISIEQAASISRALPAFVNVVALFVDAEPALIREVLNKVRVDCLQFHGDEPGEDCRIYDKSYIKAIRMQSDTDVVGLQQQYHDAAGLLLDAYHPGVQGGSGSSFDWDLIPKARSLPIILAGGLMPENAGEAIKAVKPYALDVSSGVEAGKGIKDAAKMAAFIRITNQAT